MANERQVYHTELLKLGHGLPLYEPNPAGEFDQVRVGDVGYVDRFGRFHRIFNVFRQGNDSINTQYGTPENFAPLASRASATFFRDAIPAGPMHSTHVRVMGGDFGTSGSCVPSQAKISFSVSNQQGAVLVIKYPAFREDSLFENEMAKYMLKNYRSWLAFIRDGLGCLIDLRDIVLVTGCDLTADWATATFVEKVTKCDIDFKAGDGSIAAATASFWGTWQSSINVPHRCGPGPVRPPSSSSLSISPGASSPYNATYNQCVFLRGFRVSERRFLRSPIVMKAAAEPQDMDMDRDGDLAPVLLSTECNEADGIEESPDDDMTVHLPDKSYISHNRIMDLLLEKTDADVVLVHDNDVCALSSFLGDDVHRISDSTDMNLPSKHFIIEVDPDLEVKVGRFTDNQVEGECEVALEVRQTGTQVGLESVQPMEQVAQSYDDMTQALESSSSSGIESVLREPNIFEHLPGPGAIGDQVELATNDHRMSESSPPTKVTSHAKIHKKLGRSPKGAFRVKSGCYTCRIRRKKCDEKPDAEGSCQTCVKLHLQCLGFGAKHPDWMHEGNSVTELRGKIKGFLAQNGMIKGPSASGPSVHLPEPLFTPHASTSTCPTSPPPLSTASWSPPDVMDLVRTPYDSDTDLLSPRSRVSKRWASGHYPHSQPRPPYVSDTSTGAGTCPTAVCVKIEPDIVGVDVDHNYVPDSE